MPTLLKSAPVSDREREANDRHRHAVVLVVLAVLAGFIFLLSDAAGSLPLRDPWELAEDLDLWDQPKMDEGLEDDPTDRVTMIGYDPIGDAFLKFFLVVAAAFLCAYYLPLRYKKPSLVLWTIVAVVLLYGLRPASGLVMAHLVVYQTLHPDRNRLITLLTGLLGCVAFAPLTTGPALALWLAVPLAWWLIYEHGVLRLLEQPRSALVLRTLVVHSAVILTLGGALLQGAIGGPWLIPLGLLLFLWHWARVIMYFLDYQDGSVPEDLSLPEYLAVFLQPGAVPWWDWGVQIGQGYAYTNQAFLCEDKNRVVLAGVRLLLLSMLYMVGWAWVIDTLIKLFTAAGIPVWDGVVVNMLWALKYGYRVTTPSVLVTTLVDLLRWFFLFAAMAHFRVGVWRICGYRVDPFFDRPWLATNLASFWTRFTFHYREFLFRTFYYPVFQRFFRRHRTLRIVTATFAAATFGNLIWGHVPERMYEHGVGFENLVFVLRGWPYFILLGVGISVAQLHLLRKKPKRRPWTFGPRLVLDVLAAYCTIQIYALIEIFMRPIPGSTFWDQLRLFLLAFGIRLD